MKHERAPDRVYLSLLPDAAGDKLGDYVLINPLVAPDPIEYVKMESIESTVRGIIDTCNEVRDPVMAAGFRAFLSLLTGKGG